MDMGRFLPVPIREAVEGLSFIIMPFNIGQRRDCSNPYRCRWCRLSPAVREKGSLASAAGRIKLT
jgi:hypothetical protein